MKNDILITGANGFIGSRIKGGRKYYGLDKLESNVESGESDLTAKYAGYIKNQLKHGKSTKSIQTYLEGQMQTNTSNIESGSRGFFGSGSQEPLKQANEWIKDIINNLGDLKEQNDQQGKGAALEAKQEDIINKQAQLLDLQIQAVKGTGKTETGAASNHMKIEISIKDADKIPELLMEKLINPLKKQLGDLQSQTNTLVNKESPQPAKV